MSIHLIVMIFVFLAVIFTLFSKPERIGYIFFPTVFFTTFVYVSIFSTNAFKVIVYLSPLILIVSLGARRFEVFNPFMGFYLVAVIFSTGINLLWVSKIDEIAGLRSTLPATSSVLNTVLYIAQILLIPAFAGFYKKRFILEGGIKFIVFLTTILCVYAIYQFIAYHMGWPINEIVRTSEETAVGTYKVGSFVVFRVHSLCAEPKWLASSLLPVIVLLMIPERIRPNWMFSSRLFSGWNLLLHLLVLLFTLSTSSYVAIATIAIYLSFRFPKYGLPHYVKLVSKVTIFFVVLVFVVNQYVEKDFISKVLEVRLFNRVGIDSREANFFYLFWDQREYLIFGIGLQNSVYFYKKFIGGTYTVENLGLFRLIIEQGAIAFALWGVTFFHWVKGIKATRRLWPEGSDEWKVGVILEILCISVLIFHLMRSNERALTLYFSLAVGYIRSFQYSKVSANLFEPLRR